MIPMEKNKLNGDMSYAHQKTGIREPQYCWREN